MRRPGARVWPVLAVLAVMAVTSPRGVEPVEWDIDPGTVRRLKQQSPNQYTAKANRDANVYSTAAAAGRGVDIRAAPDHCSSSSSASGVGNGVLRPRNVPPMVPFADFTSNTTWRGLHVAEGAESNASFSVIDNLLEPHEVEAILALVNGSSAPTFDSDPDTVDGMPTHEMFVESPDLYERGAGGLKLDSDPAHLKAREPVRQALQAIMEPILKQRLIPFVRERFEGLCGDGRGERACTPCYSLIRRYRHRERRSHDTHHDGHAFATAVVSLSDYGREYRGGLYVARKSSQRRLIALSRGDAVVHRSDLLHGVKVADDGGERWSWILWFRDSTTCQDHGHEWFEECANAGNPVCTMLHATKVGDKGTHKNRADSVLYWNQKASELGDGRASVKLARARLKTLPSSLPYDAREASRLYRRAIKTSDEPDGHYGLAIMLLEGTAAPTRAEILGQCGTRAAGAGEDEEDDDVNSDEGGASNDDTLRAVRILLENAARGGHPYAAFNLGIANLYGYGTLRNPVVAKEWFEASGLPEGFFAASMYYDGKKKHKTARTWRKRAKTMGYESMWREKARTSTGSGGAGGVDFNLKWPASKGGTAPPKW